jgi:protein HOOK3
MSSYLNFRSQTDRHNRRPFLEQNEKLQTAESELEELHRRLREKDLQMAELRNELNKSMCIVTKVCTLLTYIESDLSEDEKAAVVSTEHERLLALQQKTNQKLRNLELLNEERSGLLRAALLDRENLSPELLELKRVETLRQVREQIQSVINAPAEVQPNVLDTTSSEIAETVLSSEAALDKAKKVSIQQSSRPHIQSPSSAFDVVVSSMRPRQHLDQSLSAATLISSASPGTGITGKKSLSEVSISTTGTGQTSWGRIAQLLSPKRRAAPARGGIRGVFASASDCAASLSSAWRR